MDDLTNARDVGGTPLPGGASVAYGALFRGPPLADLSAAGCAEFAQLGIRTVIDLRIASERAATPESNCVNDTAQVALAPLPVPYNVSPSDYLADLNATDSLRAAFQYLGDESAYPIYIHCTWGRDRTGILAAVILSALGASRAAIQHEYQLSMATVGAYPRSLEAVLDEIERRGGIDSFLDLTGIPADQRSILRNSVTER
jgi:protein-tyrosine phosphatase